MGNSILVFYRGVVRIKLNTVLAFSSTPSQLSVLNYFHGLGRLIIMFSLAGLPPLLGFLSKLIIIKIILGLTRFFLLIIIVFSSLFILYFYIRYSYRRINIIPSNKLSLNVKSNSLFKSLYLFILLCFNTLGIVLV